MLIINPINFYNLLYLSEELRQCKTATECDDLLKTILQRPLAVVNEQDWIGLIFGVTLGRVYPHQMISEWGRVRLKHQAARGTFVNAIPRFRMSGRHKVGHGQEVAVSKLEVGRNVWVAAVKLRFTINQEPIFQ